MTKRGTALQWLLLSAFFVVAVLVALPNFVKARTTRSRNSCALYAMWIEAAKQVWAAELKKGYNDVPTDTDLKTYMARIKPQWGGRNSRGSLPFDANGKLIRFCPAGGEIIIGSIAQRVSCSITEWDEPHFQECYGSLIKSARLR